LPELTWVATDLKTGLLLADLPDLMVDSVKASLGRYESASAALPLPTAPEHWQRATLEGASVLNLLSDGMPVWGGMVTEPNLSESDTVDLSMATLEAYLDRRYVGDETFVGVGQNVIVKTLVEKYAVIGENGGVPFRVQFTTAGNGALRDRTYMDADDKTLYSVLSDLMGVDGGPEWTVGWEWQHNPERITPVLYVGDRIGRAVPAGLGPASTFEMPGCVSSFVLARSYANGRGANSVMAVSTASADVRPQSPRQLSTDTTRPTFEYRYTPSTSITAVSTLTDHAVAALAILANGSAVIALSAEVGSAPVLGVDWSIGDDIGFSIGGLEDDPRVRYVTTLSGADIFTDVFHDILGFGTPPIVTAVKVNTEGRDTVPAFPGGLVGIARNIGWEMTLSDTPMVTPTLLSATLKGA